MSLRIRSGEFNFMTPAARSELLNARRLPARLTVEQVAVLLGMSEDATVTTRLPLTGRTLWLPFYRSLLTIKFGSTDHGLPALRTFP